MFRGAGSVGVEWKGGGGFGGEEEEKEEKELVPFDVRFVFARGQFYILLWL